MNPAEDNKYAVVAKAWFNYLKDASDGQLQFEEYYNSTAAAAPDQLEAAKNGIVDIGEQFSPFWGDNFPLMELFNLPFVYPFPDGIAYSHVIVDMMEKYPEFQQEVENMGVKFVMIHGDGVNQIFSKEPIRSMADLKGKIINVGSNSDRKLMELLGATTEMMDSMEVFDNLSKGVLDGCNMCYAGVFVTGTIDAVKYITEINSSHQGWFFVMNPDTYNSLPADIQPLFDLGTSKEFIYLFGYQFAMDELLKREQLKNDPNYEIINLSDEEYAKWKEVAAPFGADWVAEVTALGYDGQAMYDDFMGFLQNYQELDVSGYKDRLNELGVTTPDGWY
jgi:TRAP-type C4-dicarboxylate transport system substrate-binding protein